MKKIIATIAAFAILGGGYLMKDTNYKAIPRMARLFDAVVLEEQNYEEALLSDLSRTKDEAIAEDIIETGHLARKRINTESKIAPNFTRSPYDLRISIKHTFRGDEAYLVNKINGQMLPIYENNHVGDSAHRMRGLEQSAEYIISDLFDEAKKDTINAVDGIFQRFEQ